MQAFIKQAAKSFTFQRGTDEIIRLCRPFLDRMGINNFYYVRITRKRELVYLTNRSDFALEYWEAGLPLRTGFSEMSHKIQSSILYWENRLDTEILDFVKTKKGYNGFSFIRRSYDVVQFASFIHAKPLENPCQFYLENQWIFSCWLREFEMKQRMLIKQAELSPILLPEEYLAQQKDSFYSTKTIELNYHQISSRISFRELDCLHLYTKGFTCPHIAGLLSLSSRTVETHLDAIKNKFGLNSRNDLATLAYINPVVNSYSPSF